MPINLPAFTAPGELTGIYVPDPADEAIRDLIRARQQVRSHQHQSRQQLKCFSSAARPPLHRTVRLVPGPSPLPRQTQAALSRPADRLPGNA